MREKHNPDTEFKPVVIDGATGATCPTPPKINLSSAEDIRRETARVYREARAGQIDPADATKLTYILDRIARMLETQDLERRLEALETILNRRDKP